MREKLLSFLVLCTLLIGVVHAQNRTVTGKVTSSSDGTPLAGVSVSVVGGTTSTQTDESGSYSIVVGSDGTLRYSYIGYTGEDVNVNNQAVINVVLTSNDESIEEVLIQVPYGTVKKTAFTGSESTISNQQIANQPVTSVTKALEGLVPGLQSTNGGGQPGSNADIRIRGIGSINAGSSPLYVLDGVPYNGQLEAINPDDIQSVTVLKDATSTALYGSRGANGVIMIQTKRGNNSAPKLTFSARMGYQERAFAEYDRVNSTQYYELMWEATRNRIAAANPTMSLDEVNNTASQELIPGLIYNVTNMADNQVVLPNGKFNPDAKILYQDDWADALSTTPFRRDYNLNFNGGSNTGSYFVSLGYLNEPGLVKNSSYERFSGRVGADSKIKEWLSAGLNMDAALGTVRNFSTGSTVTSNPWYYSRMMGPIYPVYQRDDSGNYVVDPLTGQNALDWGIPSQMGTRPYAGNSNLLGSLELDDRNQMRGTVNANTYLEAKFLNDFTFRTTLGGTYFNNYGTVYQNSQFGDADNVAGRSTKSQIRDLTFTFNQVLTYDKNFGDHNLNVLVGHENYRYQRNFVDATRTGFPFPGTSELAPAATAEGSTSYVHHHRIEGYFSNLRYDFQEKYLFSASYRRDGSSRFFPGSSELNTNQWGNFWSVGGAWRLSQESFMQNASWVNELKLKASYGQQGNEDILNSDGTSNYYTWQSLYALGNNNVNNPGAIISSLPNPALTWEKNGLFNVGVDFSLFNNKLTGTIEWYNKNTKDLLFEEPLAISTGITSIWQNVGDMNNRGWDINLGYNAIRTTDFDWRVDVNLTTFKNKITRLSDANRENGIVSGSKKLMEGHSLYDFWLRDYAGVDRETGLALYYVDVTDDEGNVTRETTDDITKGSYYWKGSAIPDLTGGLQNSFRYRDFDLSFLLNFSAGGKFYDGNYASLMHYGSYGSHFHSDILNRWTPENPDTNVPKLQNEITNQAGQSSRYLFDRSWLNVKNITLGYQLPKHLSSQIGVDGLRIFANADNVFLFTKQKGMDPGRSFNGTNDFQYVPVRTVTFGLSLSL